MSRRYALALDLVEDAELIAQYEAWHQPGRTPAPVIRSILDSGIVGRDAASFSTGGSRQPLN